MILISVKRQKSGWGGIQDKRAQNLFQFCAMNE